MIMSSEYFLHEEPFRDVVIYPTILAKDGSRMSKSKGNGVDPMDLMDKYGADAMRFNLLSLFTNNQDVKFDADIDKKTHEFLGSPRTEQARAFVTKIWNASRFLLMNMEGYTPGEPVAETAADAWMFSRLAKTVKAVTEGVEGYTFGDVARSIQSFFWNEVCDWYVEVTKARLKDDAARTQAQRNLIFVLDTSLRLMHPLMPFVTEAIWDAMPASCLDMDGERAEALMVAAWPEPADYERWIDEPAELAFELTRAVVTDVRSTRARYRISPKEALPVVVCAHSDVAAQAIDGMNGFICSLANVSELTVAGEEGFAKPEAAIALSGPDFDAYVVVGDLVDFAAEKARIEKAIAKDEKELASANKTLSNEGFIAKAAPEVVAKKRERAEELEAEITALKAQLADFA